MKLVYIEWADAVANDSWFSEEAMEEWSTRSGFICKEVGWIYQENKDKIILVSRWSPNKSEVDKKYQTSQYGLVQLIPKPWILKRVNLSRYIPK